MASAQGERKFFRQQEKYSLAGKKEVGEFRYKEEYDQFYCSFTVYIKVFLLI